MVMSESKLCEKLYGSFMSGHFSEREGMSYSKLFEELLCLSLDIFQERGGGLSDLKKINFSA